MSSKVARSQLPTFLRFLSSLPCETKKTKNMVGESNRKEEFEMDKVSRVVACMFLSFVTTASFCQKTSLTRELIVEQGRTTEAIQTKTCSRVD